MGGVHIPGFQTKALVVRPICGDNFKLIPPNCMVILKSIQNSLVTTNSPSDEKEPATGFALVPYTQVVTEPIKIILNSHDVKVSQDPFQTSGHIFAKLRDPVTKKQRTDAIYSIPCNDCNNEYTFENAILFCKKENSVLSEHTCLTNHTIG